MEPDDEDYGGNSETVDDQLDELAQRIEELESRGSPEYHGGTGLSLGYALGMALAVVLSWSRNSSIAWGILHGLLSWGYVIYFAVTR